MRATQDAAGIASEVEPSIYIFDTSTQTPRIAFIAPPPCPGRKVAGIELWMKVPFGASASQVPAPLRQVILMLTARWFENRAMPQATLLHFQDIAALDQSFEHGRTAGSAQMKSQYENQFERRRSASMEALAQSQREVAALEIQRDRLGKQFDELRETIAKSAGGAAACLDPDVVRALDELGRSEAGTSDDP